MASETGQGLGDRLKGSWVMHVPNPWGYVRFLQRRKDGAEVCPKGDPRTGNDARQLQRTARN